MSAPPQHLAGEPESSMGSLGDSERQTRGTIDESSNTSPAIFNIKPETTIQDSSKSCSNFLASRRPSTNTEFECRFPPRDPNATTPDAVSYASFGDGDTTASVTAFGQITQITRFLGIGTSGFFSVDQANVPEPWYVEDRARKLMELSGSGDGIDFTFGPSPADWIHQLFRRKPMLEFVRDRWPRFTIDTADATTTMQFFVNDSTVFGTWTCQSTTYPLPMTESISFRATQLIRELEFLNPQHSFNEASRHTAKAYQVLPGHDGKSLLIAHAASRNGKEKISCGVGVVIVFYVNGTRQKIEREKCAVCDEQDLYQIKLKEEHLQIHPGHPLEITTAYKLQTLPESFEENLQSVPLPRYHTFGEILRESPYEPLSFSNDDYVDFIVRRNLEHILSVCSIPINLDGDSKPKVALTCGDMSGHRLTAKASFLAFQFLLSVFQYLNKPELDTSGSDYLRRRIRNTCEWHLNWVFEKVERPDNQFADCYWATGKAFRDLQSGRTLSDASLAATPLQIIKQSDFVAVMKEGFKDDIKPFARSRLEGVILYWLQTLDETDKRGFSAFPRPGTQQYRLEDHVWIWRALKSIESLDLSTYLRAEGSNEEQRIGRKHESPAKGCLMKFPASMKPLSGDYLPEEIQRKVLKRFTTENTASGRRMIAVSRTPAEQRFMFYCTDTVLLYGSNPPFFDKARPLWKATIESQKFYQENEDSSWESPLRYATALIMSSEGQQINTKSATKTFEEARRILFRITPPNGLLAGQIDPVTKEPQIFHEKAQRDLYWNVSFEIPGIIWEYGEIPVQPDSPVTPANSYHINAQIEHSYQAKDASRIEKFFPSSMVHGQKGIVELADEWLYSYPDFLDFDPGIRYRFRNSDSLGHCGIETGNLISRAIDEFKERQSRGESPVFETDCLKGAIVDVVKTMRKNQRRTSRKALAHLREDLSKDKISLSNVQVCNNRGLYKRLDGLRTAQNAKKRLIWLPKADNDTALICFLASPESEKIIVSSFFDRHNRREDFLSEYVAAASNMWTTEFHLSWYQLHDKCQSQQECQRISFLNTRWEIGRAAVGFLFTGDFFDRYWTCRVLEYEADTEKELELELETTGNSELTTKPPCENEEEEIKNALKSRCNESTKPIQLFSPPDVEHPWRQRRILELLLVDFMLSQASKQHKNMLQKVIDHLTKLLSAPKSSFPRRGGTPDMWNAFFSSQINTKTYTSFSKHWPPIHCILQILENDLKAILEKVSLWSVRETDRGPERPRWTMNDERKYRPAITTLLHSNNEKVREIEQHLADIQSLSTYLTGRIECTRNELSLQSAENVRFFTLVTSVFLPLGFATAIFSMNGLPGQSELTGWAILAAVSVFVTFFVLYFGDLNPRILEARSRVEALFKGRDDEQNEADDRKVHEDQSATSDDTAQPRSLRNLLGLKKGKTEETDPEK